MQFFKKHLAGDHGANMVEYSLIVSLVALMAFAAVTLLGDSTSDTFTTAAAALDAGDPVGLGGDGPVETGQDDSPDNNDSGDVDPNQDHGQGQDDQEQDQDDDQGQNENDQGQDQDDDRGQDQDDDQGQNENDQGQDQDDDRGQDQDDDQGQNENEDQLDLSDDEQDDNAPDTGDQGQDDAGSNGEQGGQGGGAGDGDDPEEDEPAYTGPAPAGSSSELYWWDSHNTKGQWKASVSFENETNRHQYLTLQITKIDDKGKTTTSTVKDFYVGAGSSSTYTHWSNDIDKNGQKVTGVVEVQVKVISVRTSDQNWKTYSYEVNGAPASVTVPSLP